MIPEKKATTYYDFTELEAYIDAMIPDYNYYQYRWWQDYKYSFQFYKIWAGVLDIQYQIDDKNPLALRIFNETGKTSFFMIKGLTDVT